MNYPSLYIIFFISSIAGHFIGDWLYKKIRKRRFSRNLNDEFKLWMREAIRYEIKQMIRDAEEAERISQPGSMSMKDFYRMLKEEKEWQQPHM